MSKIVIKKIVIYIIENKLYLLKIMEALHVRYCKNMASYSTKI